MLLISNGCFLLLGKKGKPFFFREPYFMLHHRLRKEPVLLFPGTRKLEAQARTWNLNVLLYSSVHLRYVSLFLVNSLAKLYSGHDMPCGSGRIPFAVESINDPSQAPFHPESDGRFGLLSIVWKRKKIHLKALFSEYQCQVHKTFTYQSESFNTRRVGRAPSSLTSASLTCLVLQRLSLSNQFYLNNLTSETAITELTGQKKIPPRTISICKPRVSSLVRGSSTLEESYRGLINLSTMETLRSARFYLKVKGKTVKKVDLWFQL